MQGTGAGLAVGLAGCNGDGDGTDGTDGTTRTTTTQDPASLPAVHVLTDYNNEAWQAQWEDELIPGFTDETGIEIDIEYSGMSGEQEQRLATLIQSGEPPGINTSTFDQVADPWGAGQLEPVNDVVEAATEANGEMVFEPFTDSDGNTYQVSHGYYVSDFQYRQDVFDQLGLEVPTTFQGVLDNAQAISESDMDVEGYGLAGQRTGKAQDEFQVYLAQMGKPPAGLRWVDPDARDELEIHWPEQEITTLLQWFKDLSQYSPDPTGIGWAQSIENYVGGQFAQQYHLNIWPQGVAAGLGVDPIAENTHIAPLPYWEEGGISQGDSWLYDAAPDGHHVFSGAANTPGAKEFLRYVYGSDLSRTAGLYAAEPTRFLPNYSDVLSSDTFESYGIWQQYPRFLEDAKYVQNTLAGEHYAQVPESDIESPESIFVSSQWFYAEMVNDVVTDTRTPQEAYEWGRGRLEDRLAEARDKFGET